MTWQVCDHSMQQCLVLGTKLGHNDFIRKKETAVKATIIPIKQYDQHCACIVSIGSGLIQHMCICSWHAERRLMGTLSNQHGKNRNGKCIEI